MHDCTRSGGKATKTCGCHRSHNPTPASANTTKTTEHMTPAHVPNEHAHTLQSNSYVPTRVPHDNVGSVAASPRSLADALALAEVVLVPVGDRQPQCLKAGVVGKRGAWPGSRCRLATPGVFLRFPAPSPAPHRRGPCSLPSPPVPASRNEYAYVPNCSPTATRAPAACHPRATRVAPHCHPYLRAAANTYAYMCRTAPHCHCRRVTLGKCPRAQALTLPGTVKAWG